AARGPAQAAAVERADSDLRQFRVPLPAWPEDPLVALVGLVLVPGGCRQVPLEDRQVAVVLRGWVGQQPARRGDALTGLRKLPRDEVSSAEQAVALTHLGVGRAKLAELPEALDGFPEAGRTF